MADKPVLKKKDFESDQAVRWCPGCGDFGIVNAIQMSLTEMQDLQTELNKYLMALDYLYHQNHAI